VRRRIVIEESSRKDALELAVEFTRRQGNRAKSRTTFSHLIASQFQFKLNAVSC